LRHLAQQTGSKNGHKISPSKVDLTRMHTQIQSLCSVTNRLHRIRIAEIENWTSTNSRLRTKVVLSDLFNNPRTYTKLTTSTISKPAFYQTVWDTFHFPDNPKQASEITAIFRPH